MRTERKNRNQQSNIAEFGKQRREHILQTLATHQLIILGEEKVRGSPDINM